MYYSLIAALAIILHFVINRDVIFRRGTSITSVTKEYRQYLTSVLVFYVVDMLWGVLNQTGPKKLLYADTMAYYVTIATTVVLWCRYVASYLNLRKLYARVLVLCGVAFLVAAVIVIAINYFNPIIFDIDELGQFSSKQFRFVAMVTQFIIFFFVSAQSFFAARNTQGSEKMRYRTVAIYCTALVLTVVLQYHFTMMPLYAMGLLIGTCVLHVYVQEDEKMEIRKVEIRNENIIQALARSYEQVNYITMSDGSYLASSSSKDITDEHLPLKAIQKEGRALAAVEYACNNLVSKQFRKDMTVFADLATVNERMALTHMVSFQFKNYMDVWYEWSYIVADRNPDGSIEHLIWAIRKIEDEKQAEIRKQKILEDNIAANRAKTVFLQNMSHEIRTPLNAMFGFSQLLGMPEGSWNEEEREEYNRHVRNSYYMMDMLIGDIIDIADSEHGNYRIEIDDVRVNEICRSALTSAEYRRPADVQMRFVTDVADEHIVRSDGRRIQQVLINYLTNACKHTREGEIILSCSCSDIPGKLVFAVTDTGEGVPEEKADEIFKRFIKLDQFSQGSGLGLNICQMVARKLGGEVYLDKTYRNGARFVFVIDNA